MDVVFLVIGWLSIPVVLVAVFKMIASLKKEQILRGRQLLVMAAVPIPLLLLYQTLLGSQAASLSFWLLLAGVAAGGWVSSTVELRIVGDDVHGTRSYWYLALWAVTYSFSQLSALGALPTAVSTGLATMYAATGVAVGLNAGLWYRQSVLLNRAEDGGTTATASCASCGISIDPAASRCIGCDRRLVPVAPAAPSPGAEESSRG